jgi:hypothetical protein
MAGKAALAAAAALMPLFSPCLFKTGALGAPISLASVLSAEAKPLSARAEPLSAQAEPFPTRKEIVSAQAGAAAPNAQNPPKKRTTPLIPPLERPARPPVQPQRPQEPDYVPDGAVIVKPNPMASRSAAEPSDVYFRREDPSGWPGALASFAQALEARYHDWRSNASGGGLDPEVAWIFEELESGAPETGDGGYSDSGLLWTSESLRAFLAENLQALAVDRNGYWHYMVVGEDEDWRATGASYQDSFRSRRWRPAP